MRILLLFLLGVGPVYALDQSVAPIIGYSPTYSLALGGGYFFKDETVSGRLIGVYTLSGAIQVQPRLEAKLSSWFEWDLDITFQKGFEPYYGEGSETYQTSRIDYPAYHTETITGIRFHTSDNFSFSPQATLRTFHAIDDGFNPFSPVSKRLASPALGVNLRWDYRGTGEMQDEGFLQETQVWLSPLWSETATAPFGIIEGRFTEGITLFSNVRLVLTADLGATAGESDYAYRFKLGGTKNLRGYLDNRFRGKFSYLQGTELRVPISQMFALGFFAEGGEATNVLTEFHPKFSYGGGLRIGLPPDYVQVARIDVGFGQDSWAVYADFGLPF